MIHQIVHNYINLKTIICDQNTTIKTQSQNKKLFTMKSTIKMKDDNH